MRNLVLLLVLAGASIGCEDALSPPEPAGTVAESNATWHGRSDLRRERDALISAGNAVSDAIARRGLVPALERALTLDALFLSPRMPTIRGREAAVNFLSTNPVAPTAMRWHVIVADVSSDATQGFTWAEGFFKIDLGSGATKLPGFFLMYWRRRPTNDWRIDAIVFNAGGPQTGPVPPEFGTPTSRRSRDFPGTNVWKERTALLKRDAAFSAASVSQGTGPAFERFAARNAIAVGDPALVFGPEAIGQAFTFGPEDVVSWIPRISDVVASGDLGLTVGDATFALAEAGTFYSKYLTVWRKQANEKWKFVADYGNSRPGP